MSNPFISKTDSENNLDVTEQDRKFIDETND
jgi:hypothetical protein